MIIGTVVAVIAGLAAVSENLEQLDAFGLKQIINDISDHEERIDNIELSNVGTHATLDHIESEVSIIREDIDWIKKFLIENRNQ